MNYVKLKKVMSRKDKDIDRKYFRYDITVPNDLIDELGWQIKGDKTGRVELKWKVSGSKLVLEKE